MALPTFFPTSPPPWHHAWPACQPGETIGKLGDSRSLERAAHLCPRPRTGRYPHPQTGVPGLAPGYQLPHPLTSPSPCPSAYGPPGLQAPLPSPAWKPSVLLPPGLDLDPPALKVFPHWLLTQAPSRYKAPPHPRFPLPRSPTPHGQITQMGGGTHIWPSVFRKSRFSRFPTSRPSLLPPPSLTLLTQTLYHSAQPSLSHLWPGSPIHNRPRGSGGACASPAPRLHDNPVVAGYRAIPPASRPFLLPTPPQQLPPGT